jgi:hypothetical protein
MATGVVLQHADLVGWRLWRVLQEDIPVFERMHLKLLGDRLAIHTRRDRLVHVRA